LPNGAIDPLDTVDWPEIVCEACGGSGERPVDLATIAEKSR